MWPKVRTLYKENPNQHLNPFVGTAYCEALHNYTFTIHNNDQYQ